MHSFLATGWIELKIETYASGNQNLWLLFVSLQCACAGADKIKMNSHWWPNQKMKMKYPQKKDIPAKNKDDLTQKWKMI